MDEDDIREALESAAPARKDRGRFGDPATGDEQDTRLFALTIMRFIDQLESDVTVSDISRALEVYAK